MPTYFLIQFDGDLMFHADRSIALECKFKNYNSELEVASAIINDSELFRNLFVPDDDCDLSLYYDMSDGYDENLFNKNLKYYRKHPEKFLAVIDDTWQKGNIGAHAIVNTDEKLFKILKNGDVIRGKDYVVLDALNNS